MRSVDYLKREHRRIEEMLVALEAAAVQVETSGTIPSFIGDVLDFFQRYADVNHHAKEEAFFFPALVSHGVTADGMIGAMTHQHEMGRIHVRDMRHAIERLRLDDSAARDAFATSAHTYVELLRVHIQIEDADLYPLAEQLLTADEDAVLLDHFQTVDGSREGIAQQARWEALAARIHEPARH